MTNVEETDNDSLHPMMDRSTQHPGDSVMHASVYEFLLVCYFSRNDSTSSADCRIIATGSSSLHE